MHPGDQFSRVVSAVYIFLKDSCPSSLLILIKMFPIFLFFSGSTCLLHVNPYSCQYRCESLRQVSGLVTALFIAAVPHTCRANVLYIQVNPVTLV